MTKDNEDALRCAGALDANENTCSGSELSYHLRRLVRENDALRSANAELALACRSWKAENEAQDALLRQAVQELEWSGYRGALVAAIRQHLEGRA